MTEHVSDTWQRDIDEARAALNKRFPDLKCLRCGERKFMLRLWPDESLVPGVADAQSNQVSELICENCGFQEKHVVRLLTTEAAK